METYFIGKDSWFSEYWEQKITNSFAKWWRNYYGLPEDYESNENDLHEYFTRMAFAFMGWQANEKINDK